MFFMVLWGYICDALLKGNANVVACLPAPRAWPCGGFPSVLLFAWCFSLPFLQKNDYETTASFLLSGGFRNNRNKPLPFLVKPVDKNFFINLVGTFQANVPDIMVRGDLKYPNNELWRFITISDE
jgi:hypothetical protein